MKINRFILILLLSFHSACGYKIANNLENYNFKILDYKLEGVREINNILEGNFKRFKKNENSSKIYSLESNSKLTKSITSKNISGDALTYKLEILVTLKVLENSALLEEISFRETTNYNNTDSKFELKQYEDILVQDLMDQINSQINNYLSSLK